MDTRGPRPDPDDFTGPGDGELRWRAIEPIWGKVSVQDGPAAFLRQFMHVSREQGLLLAVHTCDAEVCSGGFDRFFQNPAGVLAPEAVKGFEFLGFTGAAEILGSAMSLLGDHYPRDRDQRQAALKALRGPGPFRDLDAKFFDWKKRSNFDEAADVFVKMNRSLFFL